MRFIHVTLRTARSAVADLADFYGRQLGFAVIPTADAVSIAVGETIVDFATAAGEPFYHFALLVPGNRFDAALAWADERTTLLVHPEAADGAFDFAFWNAHACYFHDPAGNIVELIAHRGVGETDAAGAFEARELIGVSELGLVGDLRAMAEELAPLGLEVWDGTVERPGGLAFVGERARTLILAPRGRGWLPTGRASERHDVDVLLSGLSEGEATLEASRYRIRATEP